MVAESYMVALRFESSLTTKGIGALTSLFLIERNHGVAESNWILFSCGETLVIFDWADRTIAQHDYIIN